MIVAALAALVLLNLSVLLVWFFIVDGHNSGARRAEMLRLNVTMACFVILCLIPYVFALGAGASLVGTERDTRTAGWLRSLPLQARQVGASRFLAGLLGLGIVWLSASLLFLLAGLILGSYGILESIDAPPDGAGLAVTTLCLIPGLSILQLLLGFVMIYTFRSSLVALIVTTLTSLFLMVVGPICTSLVMETFGEGALQRWLILAPLFLLAALWALQQRLAEADFRRVDEDSHSAWSRFRDHVATMDLGVTGAVLTNRPSQIGSLLWQQLRQTGPLGLLLIGMAVSVTFCVLGFHVLQTGRESLPSTRLFEPLVTTALVLVANWLGVLAFYGDNQSERRRFFADRGIGPTRVWWTRLLPVGLGLVPIVALGFVQQLVFIEGMTTLMVLLPVVLIAFAFGALVSQGIDRPLLAFIAAPVYGVVSVSGISLPVAWGLVDPNLLPVLGRPLPLIATASLLILATWLLRRRWLSGSIDLGYGLRVVGYTAAALILPLLVSLAWNVSSRAVTVAFWGPT